MSHLRVVQTTPEPPATPLLDTILENNARRYYGRTWKTGAPLWDELPDEARQELIDYVEPFVMHALTDAVETGFHDKGDRW